MGSRLDNWRAGLGAFAERPLLGWGPGNYLAGTGGRLAADFARYLPGKGTVNEGQDHAHNLPLEEAATMGVVGLLAWLALWGWTAVVVVRAVRRTAGAERVMAACAGGVLAGWCVQSQTFFYFSSAWLVHMLLIPHLARHEIGFAAAPGRGRSPGGGVARRERRHARWRGRPASRRHGPPAEFMAQLEVSIRAFEPMATHGRILLFENVAPNWMVLRTNYTTEAFRLLAWCDRAAPQALAAEPRNWQLHHALAHLYREVARTESGHAAPRPVAAAELHGISRVSAAAGRTPPALERQTYPRALFEVVVVDGLAPPIGAPADSPLDVRVVRQLRCGFGLARARNLGVRCAFFDEIGGFDAAFDRKGWEDTEFGYRAWAGGSVLGPGKRRAVAAQRMRGAALIAHPDFRPTGRGGWTVPRTAVTVDATHAPAAGDFAVLVDAGPAAVGAAMLPDGSRVHIARAWALHRARRGGLQAPWTAVARWIAPAPRPLSGVLRLVAEAGRMRRAGAAVRLGRWLLAGLRWWLGTRHAARERRLVPRLVAARPRQLAALAVRRARRGGADDLAAVAGLARAILAPRDAHAAAGGVERAPRWSAQSMARTAARGPARLAEKIVSHRYRFVWLANPKVASRSLTRTLREADPDAVLVREGTLADVYAGFPEARGYFSFAFVRHPVKRALSCHADKVAGGAHVVPDAFHGLCAGMPLDAWCAWLGTPWGADVFADRHWLSQDALLREAPGAALSHGYAADFALGGCAREVPS